MRAQPRPMPPRRGSCSRPPSRGPTFRRRRMLPPWPSRGRRSPAASRCSSSIACARAAGWRRRLRSGSRISRSLLRVSRFPQPRRPSSSTGTSSPRCWAWARMRRWRSRPRDIAAQRWRLEAAAARIGAAKADFFPNLNLAAFAGFGATSLHGLDLFGAGSGVAGVGPALHLPIFDAGRLRANLRGGYGEYDAAVEQYNQALVDALRQVADQVASVRAVQRQLADQANALAAAEDTYRLTLDRYRAGLTSYLDVLVNEERLLAERVNQVRLQGRSLALAVGTIRALGGGYQ